MSLQLPLLRRGVPLEPDELCLFLDVRVQAIADEIKQKDKHHLQLMTEVYQLEEEISRLQNVLGSLLVARDLRTGGKRAKPLDMASGIPPVG